MTCFLWSTRRVLTQSYLAERGVGKSSLANTITAKIPPEVTNIKFIKENCRPDDTFFTLWSKILFEFKYCENYISDYLKDETRDFVVIKILESLPKTAQYVFIFDEFDRISSNANKRGNRRHN